MLHVITLLRHANYPILAVSFQKSLLDKNIFWVWLYYIVWNLAHDNFFSKSKTYFLLKLAAYLCIFITEKDFSLLKSWKQLLTGTCHDWVDLCVNQVRSRLLIRWGEGGWYCKRNILQTLEFQRLESLHWGHLDPPLNSNSLSTKQKKTLMLVIITVKYMYMCYIWKFK